MLVFSEKFAGPIDGGCKKNIRGILLDGGIPWICLPFVGGAAAATLLIEVLAGISSGKSEGLCRVRGCVLQGHPRAWCAHFDSHNLQGIQRQASLNHLNSVVSASLWTNYDKIDTLPQNTEQYAKNLNALLGSCENPHAPKIASPASLWRKMCDWIVWPFQVVWDFLSFCQWLRGAS